MPQKEIFEDQMRIRLNDYFDTIARVDSLLDSRNGSYKRSLLTELSEVEFNIIFFWFIISLFCIPTLYLLFLFYYRRKRVETPSFTGYRQCFLTIQHNQ